MNKHFRLFAEDKETGEMRYLGTEIDTCLTDEIRAWYSKYFCNKYEKLTIQIG